MTQSAITSLSLTHTQFCYVIRCNMKLLFGPIWVSDAKQTEIAYTTTSCKTFTITTALLPGAVEKQHEAVGESLVGLHDGDIQVTCDGHGPEEGAGVGESGYCSLDNTVNRVRLKYPPDPVCVRRGRKPVRQRQTDQELSGSGPQVRPSHVGQHDQRRPHQGQGARRQDHRLLGRGHDGLISTRHGDVFNLLSQSLTLTSYSVMNNTIIS